MEEALVRRRNGLAMAAANFICVVLIVVLFVSYGAQYRRNMYDQNIHSLENLNRSSATVAQAVFAFRSQKIADIARYVEANGLTLEQTLDYLRLMSDDDRGALELVGQDGTGYSVVPGKSAQVVPVSYTDRTYGELQRLFKNAAAGTAAAAAYTPEFTDARTAFKCFAFYTYVRVADGAAGQRCTLLFVSRSDETMAMIQQYGGYRDLSAALIDADGNYILGSPDFKSENLFKYIYVFNGLTLDEKNALAAQVLGTDSGTLRYKNSAGEDCVFVYGRLENEPWYSVSCVPVADFDYGATGTKLTVLVTAILSALLVMDILWMSRMNRRLKQSVEREKEANAAKTEFLSRMSHDIRTPLNAILGFTAITRDSPQLAPQLQENLAKIDNSGHYLLGILNDVLDMAKIESGKVELHPEPTDCAQLFAGIADIFSGEAERRNIRIDTRFDFGGCAQLLLDPLRTKQIFSNLLSNAVKFSENGTEILWQVKIEPAADGKAHLVSEVADHGCGMSPEFLRTLFEPFSQERNGRSSETNGTGLGLAIVQRLVKLMGGEVRAESELGRGTRFTVALAFPRPDAAPQEADTAPQTAASGAALAGRRVLVCEDNALNREIAATLLGSRGIICETAQNGKEGAERFAASPVGYFDAVLMDIRMPVMNGLDAAAKIRALDRPDAAAVPILAMTANAYDEDVRASLRAGMDAHLAKPFEPDTLFSLLEKWIASGARRTGTPLEPR